MQCHVAALVKKPLKACTYAGEQTTWEGAITAAPRQDRANRHTQSEDLLVELRARSEQQAVVADLGLYALGGAELQSLMDKAVQRGAQTLDMKYCKVLELLPQGKELLLKAGVGWTPGLVGQGKVGTDHNSQAGFTLRSKEPVIVTDLGKETRFNGPTLLVEHQVVSGMSVIIHGSTGPYGVLGVHDTRQRHFSQNDIHFIQAVANVIGEAVERKRVEAELEAERAQLEKRVEERTKELESFAYTVSHDLRAPLRSINGFSHILLDRYGHNLDAIGRQYLERITHNAEHLTKLINALLELSRLTRTELRPTHVDISNLAARIAKELNDEHPTRQVTTAIQPNLNAQGDQRLLQNALTNLMRNAWKFTTPRQHARIEIGWSDKQQAFYIQDNGVGFDMKYHPKLFTPFQRAHTEDGFEGTGIGLATVHRIIDRHGGNIWAEAEVGHGATFYFTLPAQ